MARGNGFGRALTVSPGREHRVPMMKRTRTQMRRTRSVAERTVTPEEATKPPARSDAAALALLEAIDKILAR